MSCWRSGRRRRGGACGSGVGCDDWTIVRILKIVWRHEGVAHTDYDTKVLSQKVLRLYADSQQILIGSTAGGSTTLSFTPIYDQNILGPDGMPAVDPNRPLRPTSV